MRTCGHCGVSIEHKRPQAKWCGKKCLDAHHGSIWQQNNPAKIAAKSRRWRQKYPEKAKANSALHAKRHPDKNVANVMRWAKENPGRANHLKAAHEARKRRSMPKWLTDDHIEDIRYAYTFSKYLGEATGVDHHVDHIIPLAGKTVSGLHVPWNLQIIPARDNISKGNRCWPSE